MIGATLESWHSRAMRVCAGWVLKPKGTRNRRHTGKRCHTIRLAEKNHLSCWGVSLSYMDEGVSSLQQQIRKHIWPAKPPQSRQADPESIFLIDQLSNLPTKSLCILAKEKTSWAWFFVSIFRFWVFCGCQQNKPKNREGNTQNKYTYNTRAQHRKSNRKTSPSLLFDTHTQRAFFFVSFYFVCFPLSYFR